VNVVAYTDPNCPFCFATEERLHALGVAERVEWRGVEHAPGLPVPMVRTDRPGGEDLGAEVEAIRQLAPEVPIAVPPGKPSTALVIAWAAAALAEDPVAGRAFVLGTYRALWTRGDDLSDPSVLEGLAVAHGLPGRPPGPAAAETAAGWRADWRATGLPGVPVLLREDGRVVYGLADAARLRAFVAGEDVRPPAG